MKKKLAIILCFFMAVGIFANESVESKKNEIQVKMGMFPYFESVFSALVHMNDSGAIIPMPVFTAEYLNYLNPQNGICSDDYRNEERKDLLPHFRHFL